MIVPSRRHRLQSSVLAFTAAWASVGWASVVLPDLIAVLAPPGFHLGWTAEALRTRWGAPDHTSGSGDESCRHLTYGFEETRLVFTLDAGRVAAVHMIARTSDHSAFDDTERRLLKLLGPAASRGLNRIQWDTATSTVVLGGWRGEFNLTAIERSSAARQTGRVGCYE